MPSLYEMANEWSVRELKREYNRLRNQFKKQIERLAEVDSGPKVRAYMKGGYKHPKWISEIENLPGRKNWSEKAIKEDWATRVAELQGLTKARSLSISGRKAIRRDTIKTLQEIGYKNINNNNFDKFTSFMNFAKAQGVLDEYNSKKRAEAFDEWINGGIVSDPELGKYIEEWNAAVESIDLFS